MLKKILVVCNNNSSLSQMTEGWLKYYGKGKCEIYSAGIHKGELNLFASKVMMEAVIDITMHKANIITDFKDISFDYIITHNTDIEANSDTNIKGTNILRKDFTDPDTFSGTDDEKLKQFSTLRDEIEDFCFDFVDKNIKKLY
ncbi:MAG: hypothetical protein N4A72_15450 [Bacteroidales bacterium]|nr:hypothetical protein [Bacteroidales bacterium]